MPVKKRMQKNLQTIMVANYYTSNMEEAIAHPEVDVVCIALPNNVHEEAVMLCCKHKKAVITTKPLGRNGAEAMRMLKAVEEAGIFQWLSGRPCVHPKIYQGV